MSENFEHLDGKTTIRNHEFAAWCHGHRKLSLLEVIAEPSGLQYVFADPQSEVAALFAEFEKDKRELASRGIGLLEVIPLGASNELSGRVAAARTKAGQNPGGRSMGIKVVPIEEMFPQLRKQAARFEHVKLLRFDGRLWIETTFTPDPIMGKPLDVTPAK